MWKNVSVTEIIAGFKHNNDDIMFKDFCCIQTKHIFAYLLTEYEFKSSAQIHKHPINDK